MGEEVKIFRTWSSPFPLRVIWALKLKGVEYETVYEDLSNKSQSLLQYNPVYKKVPVLVHNGKPICESLVIVEYVDETWKQHPLLPQDPHERAMTRFWAKFIDDKVLPTVYLETFMKQGKEQEEGMASAMENLSYLEEEIRGKRFFGGENIGLVDIALGWMAFYMGIFEEIIGQKIITEERFPLLAKWVEEFSNVPIIQENWPSRDRLLAKFVEIRQSIFA